MPERMITLTLSEAQIRALLQSGLAVRHPRGGVLPWWTARKVLRAALDSTQPESALQGKDEALAALFSLRDWCEEAAKNERGTPTSGVPPTARARGRAEAFKVVAGASAWSEARRLSTQPVPEPDLEEGRDG